MVESCKTLEGAAQGEETVGWLTRSDGQTLRLSVVGLFLSRFSESHGPALVSFSTVSLIYLFHLTRPLDPLLVAFSFGPFIPAGSWNFSGIFTDFSRTLVHHFHATNAADKRWRDRRLISLAARFVIKKKKEAADGASR